MYIKEIRIEGFKSYMQKTTIGPFDKTLNIIVGRNGSGKSNIFQAVQLVLTDDFKKIQEVYSSLLLSKSSTQQNTSASIEIIVDNSDSRININTDEISVLRVFGRLGKDEYYINKNCLPYSEFRGILENAGFSFNNPYYIVGQGQINRLATQNDVEHYNMLKDVAGVRIFDEQMKLTIKDIEETHELLEQNRKEINSLSSRLDLLRVENEDFLRFQSLNKKRRAINFVILGKNIERDNVDKANLELEHKQKLKARKTILAKLKEADDVIERSNLKIRENEAIIRLEKDKILDIDNQIGGFTQKLEQHICRINDLDKTLAQMEEADVERARKLPEIQRLIAKTRDNVEGVETKLQGLRKTEDELNAQLESSKCELQCIYTRTAFNTNEERLQCRRAEIKDIAKFIAEKASYEKKLARNIDETETRQTRLDERIRESRADQRVKEAKCNELQELHTNLQLAIENETMTRTDLQHKCHQSELRLKTLDEQVRELGGRLRSAIGREVQLGNESMRKVMDACASKPHLAQVPNLYYGLVVDNFVCEPECQHAIQTVGRSRLFYHLVESDHVATKILRMVRKMSLPGQLNFMALNRLAPREANYPQVANAVPLIQSLRHYEAKFESVMRFVFGGAMLCRDLDVATLVARQYRLNAVTMEGDFVSSSGPITGGYLSKTSPFLYYLKHNEAVLCQERESQAIGRMTEELARFDFLFSEKRSEYLQVELKIDELQGDVAKLLDTLQHASKEAGDLEKAVNLMKEKLKGVRGDLGKMRAKKAVLEKDLASEESPSLSGEEAQIGELRGRVAKLETELQTVRSRRIDCEHEKDKLVTFMDNHLKRQVEALKQPKDNYEFEKIRTSKVQIKKLVKEIEKMIGILSEEKHGNCNKLREISNEIQGLRNEIKKAEETIQEFKTQICIICKDLEKFSKKINAVEEEVKIYNAEIDKLGTLPDANIIAEVEESHRSLKSLLHDLKQLNEEIKQFDKTNMKAGDQYQNCTNLLKTLNDEEINLTKKCEKLQETRIIFEHRKQEMIDFTLKQVSEYFTQIFKTFVPQGNANLIMQVGYDSQDDKEKVLSVAIKVSFKPNQTMKHMSHLSGGQKTIVSLALIFAIQKCLSAPFYLFDEIDGALDRAYRRAVTRLIEELSQNAQFIVTTFRCELLNAGKAFFLTEFSNTTTKVEKVGAEVAADFISRTIKQTD